MELSADPRYFHGLRQFSFPLILRQWKSRRPTRGGGTIVMGLQIGGAQIGGVQIGGGQTGGAQVGEAQMGADVR